MRYIPKPHQELGIKFILENTHCGCFAQIGTGKTGMTLTSIEQLFNELDIHKPLIIAPKRVTNHTWQAEIDKWDHLKGLKLSRIVGTPKQREAAFKAKADIYAISRDNVMWLVQYCIHIKKWPFDWIIFDESSNFKNHKSQRFKAIRKVLPKVKRVLLLTGTPMTKSIEDLWAQLYLLDQGQRLGKTLTTFRDLYMRPKYNGFGYEAKEGSLEIIMEKIADICLSIKSKGTTDVPERTDIFERVELDNIKAYEEFKKTEVLPLLDGQEITPVNAGALYNKLQQFSNGAVYDNKGAYHIVDNSKLEALLEDIELLEGKPLLIAYMFKSDFDRLQKAIPGLVKLDTNENMDAWNRGEIKVAANHPASIAYGLNLQEGGYNLAWYGVPWDLDLYLQFCGRLDRPGQTNGVIIKHYTGKDTIEDIMLARLESKDMNQDKLMEALKRHLY